MKDVIENLFGFIYSLSMGDYFFFIGTFLLIVLFIYLVYLIKCSDFEKSPTEKKKDSFDIEAVTKAIEKDYKPETIKLTSYEEEQENNAIISYEELVNNKEKSFVNYDDEYNYDNAEIAVKKIDLNGNGKPELIEEPRLEVKLMSYDKEEDFLKALKELQKNLSQ